MRQIHFIFIIIALAISTSASAQFLKLRTGDYNEPGNVKRHPYTVFYRANASAQALEDQIEAIRQKVDEEFSPIPADMGDFAFIYSKLYEEAEKDNVPAGGYGDDLNPTSLMVSERPKVAKAAAFVYLCGFDEEGRAYDRNDPADLAELEAFKNRAVHYLHHMNVRFPANVTTSVLPDHYQYRSKELIMYLEAYDLLAAAASRYNESISLDQPRDKLIDFTRRLYKR